MATRKHKVGIALLLAVIPAVIGIGLCGCRSNQADAVVLDGVCYTPHKDGWSASVVEDFAGTELTIQEEVEGLPVLEIKPFSDLPSLQKLTLRLAADQEWTIDKFSGLSGLTELSIYGGGSAVTVKANAFSDSVNLKSLTLSGGDFTCPADSLPMAEGLKSLTLSDGSVTLGERTISEMVALDSLVIDSVTTDFAVNSGFYDLSVTEMTVKNATVELSKYKLTEVYPTISVGTLYLGAGGTVSARSARPYPVERLVLAEDFTFDNGGTSMTYFNGFLNMGSRVAPIAREIHIPKSVTHIPANFFGTKDECTVYYGGLSHEFDTVQVAEEGNDALFDGLVRIYGAEESDFDVYFNTLGGSDVGTQSIRYGNTVSRPEDPTRRGYEFLGWYTASYEGRLWNFETDTVIMETTLYARWLDLSAFADSSLLSAAGFETRGEGASAYYYRKEGLHTATLDLSSCFTVSERATVELFSVREGITTPVSMAAVPLTDGENRYVLRVCSGNGEEESDYELVIFRSFLCSVTYDSEVGITSETAEHDSLLSPRTAVREGYTFEGWYDGTRKWDFERDRVTGSLTLTARWTPKSYSVTLQGAGQQSLTYGQSYALPVPEKTGCTFNGWRTEDGSFVTDHQGNSLAPWRIGAEVTLIPDFTVRSYGITYLELRGGAHSNPTSYGADRALTLEAPTAPGYQFLGWTLNGQTVTEIPAGQNGDVTLTATWRTVFYSITYENTKGASVSAVKTYTVEDTVILPELSAEGYEFMGWYLNGQRVTVLPAGTTGHLTLRAEWRDVSDDMTYLSAEEGTNPNPAAYEDGLVGANADGGTVTE